MIYFSEHTEHKHVAPRRVIMIFFFCNPQDQDEHCISYQGTLEVSQCLYKPSQGTFHTFKVQLEHLGQIS